MSQSNISKLIKIVNTGKVMNKEVKVNEQTNSKLNVIQNIQNYRKLILFTRLGA